MSGGETSLLDIQKQGVVSQTSPCREFGMSKEGWRPSASPSITTPLSTGSVSDTSGVITRRQNVCNASAS